MWEGSEHTAGLLVQEMARMACNDHQRLAFRLRGGRDNLTMIERRDVMEQKLASSLN